MDNDNGHREIGKADVEKLMQECAELARNAVPATHVHVNTTKNMVQLTSSLADKAKSLHLELEQLTTKLQVGDGTASLENENRRLKAKISEQRDLITVQAEKVIDREKKIHITEGELGNALAEVRMLKNVIEKHLRDDVEKILDSGILQPLEGPREVENPKSSNKSLGSLNSHADELQHLKSTNKGLNEKVRAQMNLVAAREAEIDGLRKNESGLGRKITALLQEIEDLKKGVDGQFPYDELKNLRSMNHGLRKKVSTLLQQVRGKDGNAEASKRVRSPSSPDDNGSKRSRMA